MKLDTTLYCLVNEVTQLKKNVFCCNFNWLKVVLFKFSQLLSGLLLVYHRKHGIRSSGVLFLFWGLASFFGAAQYRTEIRGAQKTEPDSYYQYVSYLIYYPMVLLMLLLNCFADRPPRITKYSKSQVRLISDYFFEKCCQSSSLRMYNLYFFWPWHSLINK